MQLVVWKVGDWKPGKYPSNNGQTFDVLRVAFKSLDKNDRKSYYLNLDKKQPNVVAKWEPFIKEGNVLDVMLIPKGEGFVTNDTTINKFEAFKVIKDVTKS